MKDKNFHERFGKRDYNAEIRKAIFILEVMVTRANSIYYNSGDESFLSDHQYDELTIAVAALYKTIGLERDMKYFGYQFSKPDIHNHLATDGELISPELEEMLK